MHSQVFGEAQTAAKNYLPIIKKRVGDANTANLASKFSRKNFTNLIHTSFAFNSIIHNQERFLYLDQTPIDNIVLLVPPT